ncbi:MAG TPA: GerMN domain-containing protein [Tepidimicrobium sp.]|nr:GerMN domain-containing protein [Tepidimicrobium sp.]
MKKYIITLLILALSISLVACAENQSPDEDTIIEENQNGGEEKEQIADVADDIIDKDLDEESTGKGDDIIEPTPATDEEEVVLYFANAEYIETGNEELNHLVKLKKVVRYGDIPIEEAIVKELMKTPNDPSIATGIPSTVKLLGVEVADGTAFVNFAQEGLFGSSLEEDFTIEQITRSLLELKNIHRVQFLIDGEKAETLMGHYSIMSPFEK